MDLSVQDLSALGIHQELVAHAVFFTPGQIHPRESIGRLGHFRTGHPRLPGSGSGPAVIPVFPFSVLPGLAIRTLSLDILLAGTAVLAARLTGLTVLSILSRLALAVFSLPSGSFPVFRPGRLPSFFSCSFPSCCPSGVPSFLPVSGHPG